MTSSEVAIANLLGRYAEAIDAGRLEQAAELFANARVKVGEGQELDSAALLAMWKSLIVLYPDGTPRTKHVITNLIINVDEAHGAASVRSYYTVFQKTDDLPLQAICAGRYDDTFERADDVWRWKYRDYSLLDLIGDLSRHLTQVPPDLA
jgi:SnoaL-like domain